MMMHIRLAGVFEVRDDQGRDCTPRGAKARAILAMLCQTPDRRRARRWLESRLWSDRGAEQASGSLRQALMEIRKSLNGEADRLETDRDMVRLSGVVTDLEQDRDAAIRALQSGREFLEGIDIIDHAFEDWLREERERVESSLGIRRPDQARAPVSQTARTPFVIRLGGRRALAPLPDGRWPTPSRAFCPSSRISTSMARAGQPFRRTCPAKAWRCTSKGPRSRTACMCWSACPRSRPD
jgi:hypothetical protein